MKRLLLWFLLLLLAGCAALTQPRPGSLLAAVPVGSVLTLTTPLEVPAHKARVYIQGERAVSYGKVDEYYPYCVLRLSSVSEQTRTVAPDTFTVTRAFNDTEQASRGGIMVAGLNIGIADMGDSGDADVGVIQSYYITRLVLSSPRQPDVSYLDCQSKADHALGDYLTREQFESAVGGIFWLG